MAEAIPNAGAPAQADRGRILAILVYALYIAVFVNGITAIIGVVLAYVGRGEARGTVYESHFNNAITVFWVWLAWFAVLMLLVWFAVGGFVAMGLASDASHVPLWPGILHSWSFALIPVIAFGSLALLVWYLYRVLSGLVRALDGKPY